MDYSKKNKYAVALGRLGGMVKSEAKARAARENGKRAHQKLSEDLDSFGEPKMLAEMARIGDYDSYSFWIYTEPLKNPSFHLRHKTDFEVVIQMKDLKVLEIKHNNSRLKFEKGKLPPKAVKDVIDNFLLLKNSKDRTRTNKDAMNFAWLLLNE